MDKKYQISNIKYQILNIKIKYKYKKTEKKNQFYDLRLNIEY